MFNLRKRKPPPDLEAALADLVRCGVALAEVVCSSFKRDTPISPAEIDAIERMIVSTLIDDAQRAMLANGMSGTAVGVIMPGLVINFRAAFSPRFRELAQLMTPSGSA
jgi:hypothetical protein